MSLFIRISLAFIFRGVSGSDSKLFFCHCIILTEPLMEYACAKKWPMIVYKWPHSGLMCKNTDGNSIEASDATLQQSNFNDDMWFIHNDAN